MINSLGCPGQPLISSQRWVLAASTAHSGLGLGAQRALPIGDASGCSVLAADQIWGVKHSSRLVSNSCLGVEYTENTIEPAVRARAGCRYGLYRTLTKAQLSCTPGWRKFGRSMFNGIATTLPGEPMLF